VKEKRKEMKMKGYRKVSKEEFYGQIYKDGLDLILTVIPPWPYTTIFKFRNEKEWGRVIDDEITGAGKDYCIKKGEDDVK